MELSSFSASVPSTAASVASTAASVASTAASVASTAASLGFAQRQGVRRRAPGAGSRAGAGRFAESLEALPPTTHTHRKLLSRAAGGQASCTALVMAFLHALQSMVFLGVILFFGILIYSIFAVILIGRNAGLQVIVDPSINLGLS